MRAPTSPLPTPLPETAVLLVLLPLPTTEATRMVLVAALALLNRLQHELGPAIRVLRIDEASHPAVVHSFDGHGLPAFILIRDGVELWRQQGLPDGDSIVAQLLSKLHPPQEPPKKSGQ